MLVGELYIVEQLKWCKLPQYTLGPPSSHLSTSWFCGPKIKIKLTNQKPLKKKNKKSKVDASSDKEKKNYISF